MGFANPVIVRIYEQPQGFCKCGNSCGSIRRNAKGLDNFERKMSAIYNKLNAKYLYSILYQIKQKQNGGGELSLLQFESKWDTNSHAKENKAVNIVTDNESYVISDLSMKRIGYIDQEAFDIYSLLKNGKSVSDITNELYDKYKQKSKYRRFGKPSFLCAVLDNCLRMEQLGLIHRV